MRVALIILNLFGILWAIFALWTVKAPPSIFVVPVALSATILLAGWKSASDQAAQPHQRRVVRIWSLIEGALMLLAVVLLQGLGAQQYIPAAFSVIVGLHFFPLARGFPMPLYYWTGAALTAIGVFSAALPSARLQALVPSSAGALTLWATAIAIIVSARHRQERDP